MFQYKDNKINDHFKIEELIKEINTSAEKFGELNSININCNNSLGICELEIQIDYKEI